MVKAAENTEGAFVEYFWHWKDDLSRIEKKTSYLYKFKPWNWVIGTGVYLDDVERELSGWKKNIIMIGLLLTGISGIFAFFLSLRNTLLRKKEADALEKLKKNEDKLSSIFNYIPVGIAINLFEDGSYLSVNPAFCEITGLCDEELSNLNWNQTGLLPGKGNESFMQEFLQNKSVANIEIVYNYSDKEKKILLYSAVFIDYETSSAVLSMILDITRVKKIEDALRQSQKLDVVGQLTGGIAHDFNNMLTAIIGGAEILSMKLGEDSPLMKNVNLILKGGRRAADLTRKLLSFSHKSDINMDLVNIHDVIDEAIALLEKSIDKNIEIEKIYTAELPLICGDSTLLQNVFLNLGLNSKDAMKKGGTLSFSTENIKPDKSFVREHGFSKLSENYIEIDVSDSGSGISKEIINQIFDPFFTTKPTGAGSGLGLSVAYGTIKDHSGIINVYSEKGTGTVFKIYLPVASSGNKKIIKDNESVIYGSGKILVIDDEEVVLNNSKNLLEALGYDVQIADDGIEGVEIFRSEGHNFDLIIIDMIMPGIDGMETFKLLQKVDSHAKVLFSSGFTRGHSISDLLKTGACGFIQKPYQLVPLSITVAEAISKNV